MATCVLAVRLCPFYVFEVGKENCVAALAPAVRLCAVFVPEVCNGNGQCQLLDKDITSVIFLANIKQLGGSYERSEFECEGVLSITYDLHFSNASFSACTSCCSSSKSMSRR